MNKLIELWKFTVALWSTNNEKYTMNEDQYNARESSVIAGIISAAYRVLIINRVYERKDGTNKINKKRIRRYTIRDLITNKSNICSNNEF